MVYFLSSDGGSFREYQVSDDGIIRSNFSSDVAPEALGPTAAHEVPQDLLDEDMDVDDADSDDDDDANYANSIGEDQEEDEEMDINDEEDEAWEDDESSCNESDLELSPDFERLSEDSVGVLNADSDDESVEQLGFDYFDSSDIPVSQTGTHQVDIETENYDAYGEKVPTCVLFNKLGHLLTRTGHKLRMNKKHRAVFEKLVSKSSSKVIPLVCTLKPSCFLIYFGTVWMMGRYLVQCQLHCGRTVKP